MARALPVAAEVLAGPGPSGGADHPVKRPAVRSPVTVPAESDLLGAAPQVRRLGPPRAPSRAYGHRLQPAQGGDRPEARSGMITGGVCLWRAWRSLQRPRPPTNGVVGARRLGSPPASPRRAQVSFHGEAQRPAAGRWPSVTPPVPPHRRPGLGAPALMPRCRPLAGWRHQRRRPRPSPERRRQGAPIPLVSGNETPGLSPFSYRSSADFVS